MNGTIRKIKWGYNPNSSSIGTHVNVFLWTTVAVTTLVNTVIAVLSALRKGRGDDRESKNS